MKTSNITGPKHSTGRSEPRYPQTTLLPGSASGWNATERSSISLKDQHHLGLRRTYQNPALAPSLFLSQRKRVEQDGPAVSVVWFSPKGSGFKPVCRHSVTCSRPPRARCSLTHIHSSGTCVPRCYVMLSLIHTRISLFEEQKESGAEKVVKLWRQKEFCLNCAFGMGAGPGLTVIGRGHGFTLQTSFIEETTRGKEEGIHWLHSFEKSSFKKLNPSNTALIYFLMLYRGDGWFQPAVETQSSTPLCSSLNEMD